MVVLMVRPRVKHVGLLLGGNMWRWMAKVLCKPKRRSGRCCVMQSLCRALQMVTCMMSFLVMRRQGQGEWAGVGHVLFPAGAEGKEDKEAKVVEGVDVLVFFLAKEGAGGNSFN